MHACLSSLSLHPFFYNTGVLLSIISNAHQYIYATLTQYMAYDDHVSLKMEIFIKN